VLIFIPRENKRLEDLRIVADMNGNINIRAEVTPGITAINYEILDKSGKSIATFQAPISKSAEESEYGNLLSKCSATVASPELWTAETPVLYTLKASVRDKKGIIESTSIKFGFRTVEISNKQLLVNGKAILIKGADRHEMNAYKGYVVSESDMIRDIQIMKHLEYQCSTYLSLS